MGETPEQTISCSYLGEQKQSLLPHFCFLVEEGELSLLASRPEVTDGVTEAHQEARIQSLHNLQAGTYITHPCQQQRRNWLGSGTPPPPQGKVRGWQRHEGSRTQMVESSLSSDLRKSPRRKLVLTGRHREGALGIWEPLNC